MEKDRFLPDSPHPDFIFGSNYGRCEKEGRPPRQMEDVKYLAASLFDIPVEDVIVIYYTPEYHDNWHSICWAAFIHKKHQDRITLVKQRLDDMLHLLEEVYGEDLIGDNDD